MPMAIVDKIMQSRSALLFRRGSWKESHGRKLIRGKLWDQAERFYEDALAKYPDNSLFLERLAIVKRELGKEKESEELFSRLVSAHPRPPRYLSGLARTLVEFGRRPEAAARLEAGLKSLPRSTRILNELADIHLANDDWQKAKAYYTASFSIKKPTHATMVTYLNACQRHNDWADIEAANCSQKYKDYYLRHAITNAPVRESIFSGIPHASGGYADEVARNPALCLAMNSVRLVPFASRHVNVIDFKRVTTGVPPNSTNPSTCWGRARFTVSTPRMPTPSPLFSRACSTRAATRSGLSITAFPISIIPTRYSNC